MGPPVGLGGKARFGQVVGGRKQEEVRGTTGWSLGKARQDRVKALGL